MLTYEEEEGEREYWEQVHWEEKNGMDYYRTVVRNGIEFHYAGSRLLGKYDHKTGRTIK